MNPKKATRSDWKIQPMPELKTQLQVEEIFTKEEYKYLTWGFIPVSMDDKWFFFLENDWLYIHRSWTGFCIFEVRLEKVCNDYKVAEAWVNDDPKQRYDKFLLVQTDILIRYNREKVYCFGRVIIAFFICIFFNDTSIKNKKILQPIYIVFELNFLCSFYLTAFNDWDFYRDLYDFIDYYNIGIKWEHPNL